MKKYNFETFNKSVYEFFEKFGNQLSNLKKHKFIAEQQSNFFSQKKLLLEENEAVVTLDFAENYSFDL